MIIMIMSFSPSQTQSCSSLSSVCVVKKTSHTLTSVVTLTLDKIKIQQAASYINTVVVFLPHETLSVSKKSKYLHRLMFYLAEITNEALLLFKYGYKT